MKAKLCVNCVHYKKELNGEELCMHEQNGYLNDRFLIDGSIGYPIDKARGEGAYCSFAGYLYEDRAEALAAKVGAKLTRIDIN